MTVWLKPYVTHRSPSTIIAIDSTLQNKEKINSNNEIKMYIICLKS